MISRKRVGISSSWFGCVGIPTGQERQTPGPEGARHLYLEAAAAREAGVDHLYFHEVGDDQEGFLSFWDDEIAPTLER
jgi:hypothetical protein